jgi:hypothetical protein
MISVPAGRLLLATNPLPADTVSTSFTGASPNIPANTRPLIVLSSNLRTAGLHEGETGGAAGVGGVADVGVGSACAGAVDVAVGTTTAAPPPPSAPPPPLQSKKAPNPPGARAGALLLEVVVAVVVVVVDPRPCSHTTW